MRVSVLVAALVAAAPAAFAQAPDASFNDSQKLGLRLFSQSCGVCHTPVQQRARQFGPVLSRESLGGERRLQHLHRDLARQRGVGREPDLGHPSRADDAFLAKHDLTKGSMMLIDEARADQLYAAMGAWRN